MKISITKLDDHLKKTESGVRALHPDCEKKIVWASESGVKSITSVVFIHGFSATRFECSPVIDMVAEKLEANLYFARLRGHGQDGRALAESSFDEFMEDTIEAIEIGKTIGDEVIVIGSSTGCSLIHVALGQGEQIKSAVYISPNFGPKPLKGQALRIPGAKFLVPLIVLLYWLVLNPQFFRLYKKSDCGIIFKKPIEACPNNLAPTSSTTMMLILGDAIAVTLIKMRGFNKSHFGNFHPGGNLGKDLVQLSDIMHGKSELPLANINEKMSSVLLKMTKMSFGCVGVINSSKNLIGIIPMEI